MIQVSDSEMTIIVDIVQRYLPNSEVRAFGSRYRGTAKAYSDLDIAILNYDKTELSIVELARIREAFEESTLPYRVDILDYYGISDEFKAIIDNGYEVVHS
jgi:predicted nucleotidyltransferase